jgi:hypothetical protein
MSFRRGISLLAIWGVLLHAAIVVRHNAMALQGHFLAHELTKTLGVICHNAGGIMKVVSTEGTAPIDIPGQQSDCPLCTGMMPAVAFVPIVDLPLPQMTATALRIVAIARVIHERVASAWPPPRGPPLIV